MKSPKLPLIDKKSAFISAVVKKVHGDQVSIFKQKQIEKHGVGHYPACGAIAESETETKPETNVRARLA
jgi:hypothetical protein